MKARRSVLALLAIGFIARHAAAAPIAFDRSPGPDPVRFRRDILPVLQANCLPCHNQTRAKASLNLESPARMLEGGDSGPAIVPGDPDRSLLLRTAAHEVEDLAMPPRDNKANARDLSPSELSLLASWIAQGAPDDLATSIDPAWKPIDPGWRSSFALAVTHDGRLAAVGRANRIEWVDVHSGAHLGTLTDPDLGNASQRDVVGALAFSPDDTLLAAAGFREVRLWKRRPVDIRPAWTVTPDSPWVAARLSPRRTLIALQTGDGARELRSLDSGVLLRRWTPGGPDEPVDATLAWARGGLSDGPAPAVTNAFPHDPRPVRDIARTRAGIDLARQELARADRWIPEAETAVKASGETLAKARDKQAADAGGLADLEKELAAESGRESEALGEHDRLAAELARFNAALQSAEALLQEARSRLPSATAQHTREHARAALADRIHQDLQRLADGADTGPSVHEALKAAAAAADSAREQASAAHAALTAAQQDLESRAVAVGRARAEADHATADIPPRIQQAGERLAAARKAIDALKPRIDKARVTLDGSTRDVALAEMAVARAGQSLADARAAHDLATGRIARGEADLEASQARADRIAREDPQSTVLSTDASLRLVVGPDGVATAWETGPGHARVTFDLPQTNTVATLALGPDRYLSIGPTNAWLVDVSCRWALHRVLGDADPAGGSRRITDRVNALAFSPDGRLLATGGGEPSRSGELLVWNVADGSLERDLGPVHSDCVTALAFSPRGQWLASGGADRFARISRLDVEAPRIDLEGHTHHVLGVAWSPDATVLATAGAEGVVKLWNPATGERRRQVDGFGKEITGLQAVAATGSFVAMGADGRGRILRGDGEKIRDLAPVPGYLQVLALSPDGALALAADDRGGITCWNLADGTTRPAP